MHFSCIGTLLVPFKLSEVLINFEFIPSMALTSANVQSDGVFQLFEKCKFAKFYGGACPSDPPRNIWHLRHKKQDTHSLETSRFESFDVNKDYL